jgi:hypothetical protein
LLKARDSLTRGITTKNFHVASRREIGRARNDASTRADSTFSADLLPD